MEKFELKGETGLVVIDEMLGVSIIQKLKDNGVRVPQNMSIVAFNTFFG